MGKSARGSEIVGDSAQQSSCQANPLSRSSAEDCSSAKGQVGKGPSAAKVCGIELNIR